MARNKNRCADEQLVMLLAFGATQESAARQAGVSVSTVKRRLSDSVFRRKMQALLDETVRRTAGAFTAAGAAAPQMMLELTKAPFSGAVRLGATRSMVELGIKLRETADLEQRLAALEERLAATSPT